MVRDCVYTAIACLVELENYPTGTKFGHQYRSDVVRRWERSWEPYTRDCLQRWDCYSYHVPSAKEHENTQEERATKRRRKDGLYDKTSLKHIEVMRVQRNYLPEEKYWEPGPLTESYLFHCFTHCGTTRICFVGLCVLLCGTVFVVVVVCN